MAAVLVKRSIHQTMNISIEKTSSIENYLGQVKSQRTVKNIEFNFFLFNQCEIIKVHAFGTLQNNALVKLNLFNLMTRKHLGDSVQIKEGKTGYVCY